MKPLVQSRVGNNGRCLAACLASILEIPESKVPEYGEADWQQTINKFLKGHGLRYRRVSANSAPPLGYHTIEGISPRGGMHAVVGKRGRMVHDPHPQDGTGRGLVTREYYGVLTPTKV